MNVIKKNIANIITIFRLISAIIFAILYYKINNKIILQIIFTIISLSDIIDGYIARKLKQESKLGEILDPIADKLLVITVIIIINMKLSSIIIIIPSVIIIIREITITYIRTKTIKKHDKNIKVIYIAKIKTMLQMISLILLINNSYDLMDIENIFGILFLYISILPLIISFYTYVKIFTLLDRK